MLILFWGLREDFPEGVTAVISSFQQPPLLSFPGLCSTFFFFFQFKNCYCPQILTFLLPLCLLLQLPYPITPIRMKTPGEQGPLCQKTLNRKEHKEVDECEKGQWGGSQYERENCSLGDHAKDFRSLECILRAVGSRYKQRIEMFRFA